MSTLLAIWQSFPERDSELCRLFADVSLNRKGNGTGLNGSAEGSRDLRNHLQETKIAFAREKIAVYGWRL